ncbi:GntR family transcriptional regulator [Actinacidiphila sp. ITFR-21]|uniref:GntR family transcriptional regulator n=1 Tax=Actinacidiphila sp. ITFR-21 TaxID=3075199 RepID=UPI002889E3EC|nr:GntR family transcriptional regulator [Streptomyces sp. ITFR-21]WNI19596.1 GntR family transcriptional regulator [Streptomyces sp. ITFR-21]
MRVRATEAPRADAALVTCCAGAGHTSPAEERTRQNDGLPGEAAVTERYEVCRRTARQALIELEGAGLIETHHGKGRSVKWSVQSTADLLIMGETPSE